MFELLALLIGFIPLVWGANILTDGSAALAYKYNVSNFFVGLTIVAFGTSSPEIAVNIFAAIKHNNFITTGNALGSNIFNIAIILAMISFSSPLFIKSKPLKFELIYTLLAGVVILLFANDQIIYGRELNQISRLEGIIFLVLFLVFTVYLYRLMLTSKRPAPSKQGNKEVKHPVAYVLMGLGLVIAGGQLIVFSAQGISAYFEISERLIAILFISIGTSLPELVTAVTAARKGNTDLATGNILGSCIFNVFIVLGISSLIFPISIGDAINEDVLVHLLICALLVVFVVLSRNKRLKKWMGASLVVVYIGYVSYLVVTAL